MVINKKPVYFFSFLFVLAIIFKVLSYYYTVNISSSLPRGIYRIYKTNDIKKNDIVMFLIPKEAENLTKKRKYHVLSIRYFMKKYAATNDDQIRILGDNLYINSVNWGKIYFKDIQNRFLPQLSVFQLTPKSDEFLPLSSADFSYDGRYFGPIKIKDVKYKCKLVFSF